MYYFHGAYFYVEFAPHKLYERINFKIKSNKRVSRVF